MALRGSGFIDNLPEDSIYYGDKDAVWSPETDKMISASQYERGDSWIAIGSMGMDLKKGVCGDGDNLYRILMIGFEMYAKPVRIKCNAYGDLHKESWVKFLRDEADRVEAATEISS